MTRVLALLLTTALLLVVGARSEVPLHAAGSVAEDRANAVWGQPDFVSGQCKHANALTLCRPAQVAVDAHGDLWVADFVDNRVLMYQPGRTVAMKVFGQYGSFRTNGCNQRPPRGSRYPAAPNRYTLCQPTGVAVDARGTLYVADSINNRVLVYLHAATKRADAPADRVLGQPNLHTTASNDVPRGGHGAFACRTPRPASACTLSGPMELSIDSRGDLLVPDLDNHRVLRWSTASLAHLASPACAHRCFVPAAQVWGQYGSFSTNADNNPAIPHGTSPRCTKITIFTPVSACTLSDPWAAVADAQGDLFVADTSDSRVLEYDQALTSNRQDATGVYGQGGSFASRNGNQHGVSAASLWHPLALALDPGGNLWVADFYNMRVLEFPPPTAANSTTAIAVLGQDGAFNTSSCAVGAQSLCGPTGVAFDAAGHAFVTDGFNSRVLEFLAP